MHRLAEVSVDIIDQMVAQGVPFAREYGGLLDNRSFGGAQVSRTFYARGQTGQQLLIGAYQQLARQIGLGNVKLWNRIEMVDVVNVDGRCAGIVTRDLMTGELARTRPTPSCSPPAATAMPSTCRPTQWPATSLRPGVLIGVARLSPTRRYTQIHPTCIPQADDFQSKLTLMSESLRNDGRIWVPKDPDETRQAATIPEDERDYYLERIYPSFGNLAPRDVSSRAAKRAVDHGQGVGPLKNGVYLDFADRSSVSVLKSSRSATATCSTCTSGSPASRPYEMPMRIYPASHYTMGGLWVDYELQTTSPRPVLCGRGQLLRPRREPPRRLGADAGAVRRLLRAAVHDCPVPCRSAQQADS